MTHRTAVQALGGRVARRRAWGNMERAVGVVPATEDQAPTPCTNPPSTPAPKARRDPREHRAARGAGSRADRRRGTPLQPSPDHPRRGHDRSEAPEEREGPGDRRRRSRQPRAALPRRGRRGDPGHRGVRRGRRVEPPAPDHPHPVRHREVQGPLGQGVDRRGQSARQRRAARGAPRQRQRLRRLRGLRPHHRRHRQLRDPLHGQRRGVLPRDPLRLGLDLPRRPRRAWSPRAPRAACWACCAPRSARSRSTRPSR